MLPLLFFNIFCSLVRNVINGVQLIIVPDIFAFESVYADGSICLDILQNQWSPIYDVAAILTSIQVLWGLFDCRLLFI